MPDEETNQETQEQTVETPSKEAETDGKTSADNNEVNTETSVKDTEKSPVEDYKSVTETEEAAKILEKKGFNYQDLQKEYDEQGDITKETRAKLAEIGITSEIVDEYIAGKKARAEAQKAEWAESVGGQDKLQEVLEWAGSNLTADEISSINSIRDNNVIKIILKDLKQRMTDKEGSTPDYTKGEGSKGASGNIFRSQAEMFEAIQDPRYRKDEAYREDVRKKITASREAGIDLGI